MVLVESCGVEGWIVNERHAAGQSEQPTELRRTLTEIHHTLNELCRTLQVICTYIWYDTNVIITGNHRYLEWSLLNAAGLKDGL
jgi:hypothetical protein